MVSDVWDRIHMDAIPYAGAPLGTFRRRWGAPSRIDGLKAPNECVKAHRAPDSGHDAHSPWSCSEPRSQHKKTNDAHAFRRVCTFGTLKPC